MSGGFFSYLKRSLYDPTAYAAAAFDRQKFNTIGFVFALAALEVLVMILLGFIRLDQVRGSIAAEPNHPIRQALAKVATEMPPLDFQDGQISTKNSARTVLTWPDSDAPMIIIDTKQNEIKEIDDKRAATVISRDTLRFRLLDRQPAAPFDLSALALGETRFEPSVVIPQFQQLIDSRGMFFQLLFSPPSLILLGTYVPMLTVMNAGLSALMAGLATLLFLALQRRLGLALSPSAMFRVMVLASAPAGLINLAAMTLLIPWTYHVISFWPAMLIYLAFIVFALTGMARLDLAGRTGANFTPS